MAKKLGMQNAKKVLEALNKIACFNVPTEELAELTPSVICENKFFYAVGDYNICITVDTYEVEVTVTYTVNSRCYEAIA